MKLSLDEIMSVIDKVKDAGLTAFAYQDADIRLKIGNKNMEDASCGMLQNTKNPQMPYTAAPEAPSVEGSETLQKAEAAQQEGQYAFIESPMVGTFYAAASEKEESFVKVGDTVKAGQTVGIVEAMKLMNEIEAECSGVVEEILAENGQMVEYGQPLMRVRTDE